MLTQNSELRERAWKSITSNWKPAVLATLVVYVVIGLGAGLFSTLGVSSGFSSVGIATFLYWVFIFALCLPIVFSYTVILLYFLRGEKENILEDSLYYFKENYSRATITSILLFVYTFLWSLLFLIPGIIKSYSYAMTMYIADEMPEKSTEESIQLSMKMMYGNKWKLFVLDLSFIGWFLLGIVTFGLSHLFVHPYWMMSRAAFYEDLKANSLNNI